MGIILNIYDKHYKKLLIIPILLLILSMVQIGHQIATTGSFVERDYSLKGGTEITIQTDYKDIAGIKEKIQKEFQEVDDVRALTQAGSQTGLIVTHAGENVKNITSYLKKELNLTDTQVSTKTMGSSLAEGFFQQTIKAVVAAFIFMAVVVFYFFRTPIPCLAVVLAAFSDIMMALAAFNLLGMKLSTAGVAAFLMLVGYSVDTDILLTTRVLKRTEGTVFERVMSSVKTGLTMMAATTAAVVVALLVTQSEVIKQIMIILLLGLAADVLNTWIQNAGILRLYMERKAKKQENVNHN